MVKVLCDICYKDITNTQHRMKFKYKDCSKFSIVGGWESITVCDKCIQKIQVLRREEDEKRNM